MRRIARMTQVFLLTILAVTLGGTAAWAAPVNDDIGGAVVISGLPFTHQVNTAEAAVAPGDPATACFGPTATVWYTFTANATTRVQIDTIGSDYDTTLAVFTGTPGQLTEVTCNDDAAGLQSVVRFDATAGTQYFIMAGTCCGSPVGSVGPGGNLVLNASVAPPPPTIDLTLDPRGVVTRQGQATISGTVTCNVSSDAFVGVELVQRHGGRLVARGSNVVSVPCGPTPTPWSVSVDSFTGVLFGPGQASATVNASVCNLIECASDQVTGTVQLRRA
jgi:hypothetical protein